MNHRRSILRTYCLGMIAYAFILSACSHSSSGAISNSARFRLVASEDPPVGYQIWIRLYNDNGDEKILVRAVKMSWTSETTDYGKVYESDEISSTDLYSTNVVEYWFWNPNTNSAPAAYPSAVGVDTAFGWGGMSIIDAGY